MKEKGFAGGGGKKPTVTSPREYKHRFREAMERYVLEAPRYVCPLCADFILFSWGSLVANKLISCWHLFRMNYMGVPVRLHHPREVKESLGLDQNKDDSIN